MNEKIIVISVIVFFLWFSMQDGNIFGKIRVWFGSVNPFWKKPLFDCPACMTPWYGTILYWVVYCDSVFEWIIVVAAASGINAMASFLIPEEDNSFSDGQLNVIKDLAISYVQWREANKEFVTSLKATGFDEEYIYQKFLSGKHEL